MDDSIAVYDSGMCWMVSMEGNAALIVASIFFGLPMLLIVINIMKYYLEQI